MKFFAKLLVLFLFLPFGQSLANKINFIKIQGNQRISQETINEIIDFKKGTNYSFSNINDIQKKLFKTGFFKNINIKIEQNNLIINVIENPIIDFFYIQGIINKEREEKIFDAIQLGQNKIFTEAILKQDIEKIKSIYSEYGFFNVDIEPQISKLSGNSLNVIIKIKKDEKFKIKRVFFIGDKHFSSSTLYDVISSSEHGWWKFLSGATTVNQGRLDYDEYLLKNFYLNEGFYDVQISSSEIEFISEKQATITFSINSGKQYFFSGYKIKDDENNLSKKNINDIKELLSKKIKDNYSLKTITNLKDQIYDYLNLNKVEFVKFNILGKKQENNKIFVDVVFSKSERKFVNLINVKGNSITEEEVIRRNMIFAEGDTFANHKLEKSKDNIRNTGIFEDVKTNVKKVGNELVDVEVSVTEQPTGNISAGVGIGSSGSSVSTGLQEKNLFGKGINVNSNLSVGTEKISGIVSFNLPDFRNTGNTFGYDFYVRSTDYDNAGYESTLAGNTASIRYQLYENLSLRTGLGFDRDKIDTNSTASALYKKREGNYMTYKGFYNLDNDMRDRKFQTTKGHKIGFGQTLAIPGSDIPYIGNDVYGSYFHPLSKEFIINLKGGLSSINALDNKDVKLSDRKFLSSRKLRGFESFGVGPKDGKDHIGGNYSAYSSISSTVPNPLPDKWNAHSRLFVDAGNVWGVDYDSSKDSDKIRSSAGVTLDWISPLGPLSFVFAETISSAHGDEEESFNFQIGSSF